MKLTRLPWLAIACLCLIVALAVTLVPDAALAAVPATGDLRSLDPSWLAAAGLPFLAGRVDLKELRAKLQTVKTAALAKHKDYEALRTKENRTAEDDAKLQALDADLAAAEKEVQELEAKIDAEERSARRAGLFGSASRPALATTSTEPDPARTAGFRNLSEFAVAVRNAVVNQDVDERLRATPSNFHQNSGAAGEGYLVPAQMREQIWSLVFDEPDLLTLMSPEPTSSNVVTIPKDETTPWGTSGVQAYWRAEAAQMTASKAAIVGSTVPLHELYAFVLASDELLADAPRLNSLLTARAARAIRWKASHAIMWGNGVGQPLGFMNSGALVSVAKESGQAADTIVAKNVLKMYARLLAGGRRAFFVANQDTIPEIATMTIGDQPMWLAPNAGLRDAPDGMLLGRPLILAEHAETVGDLGDIVLVNPDGYFAATKAGGGIDFAASIHLYFDYGLQAFRWTFRLGGQPFLSAPVSPRDGANTKSHFVALAARA